MTDNKYINWYYKNKLNIYKEELIKLQIKNRTRTNDVWNILIVLLKTLFIYTVWSINVMYNTFKILNLKTKIFMLKKKIK